MTQVTKQNFEDILPAVKESIEGCLFMAMDFELTGLYPHGTPPFTSFDTVQQRYENSCRGADSFIPIQFGLCTVSWDEEEKQYHTKSFTFFIHPHTSQKGYQFKCDLSSLQFLSSHQFDFNTLFAHGISFTSRERQQQYASKDAEREKRPDIVLKPEDDKYLQERLAELNQWIQSTEETFTFAPCNSFLIRVLYQQIPKVYPNLNLASVEGEGRWKSMRVGRGISNDKKEEKEKKKEQEKEKEYLKIAGFRAVVDLMTKAKKPILGHNMLLDLCYFYKYFLGQLPNDVKDFSSNLLSEFPFIIDTKYIAESDNRGNTALGDLYKALEGNENPKIVVGEGDAEGTAHAAGFDAFMTASIFLKLSYELDENLDGAVDFSDDAGNRSLWNKTNITRLPQDLDLEDPHCPVAIAGNVFHVYDFDTAVQTSDIFKWFMDYGKVFVSWKDDTSCFVTIDDESQLEKVQLIENNRRFNIETLQALRERENASSAATPPGSPSPLDEPPRRPRRSSMRPNIKRARPKSIEFDTEPKRKKKKSTEQSESGSCVIC